MTKKERYGKIIEYFLAHNDADRNGQRYLYTSVDELDTLKNITSRGSHTLGTMHR